MRVLILRLNRRRRRHPCQMNRRSHHHLPPRLPPGLDSRRPFL